MYAQVNDEEDQILYSLVLALYDPRTAPPRRELPVVLRPAWNRPAPLRWLGRAICVVGLALMLSIPSSRSPMTAMPGAMSGEAPRDSARKTVVPLPEMVAASPVLPQVEVEQAPSIKAPARARKPHRRARRSPSYIARYPVSTSPAQDVDAPPTTIAARIDGPAAAQDRTQETGGSVPAPDRKQGTEEEMDVEGGKREQAHTEQVKEALDAIRTLRLR